MKQYLHTIMRSLCIMVMLCGISNGAWAQSFSSGSGEDGDPYIISSESDWNEFLIYNYDGNYFKLGDDIVLTTAPTESVTINCDFNNDDNHTISVGTQDTPASVDDFSSITPLFDDSSWESIVTYCYSVTNSNWNSLVSSYSSLTSNGTASFKLGENIEFSSSNLPESSLSVSDSDFFLGDYTITVGGESDAVEFSSSFTHVFDNDFDSQVTYYFYVTSSTWDDFVTYYNELLSDKSKVYLVLTEDIELENEPSNPLSINDDQFIDNDHKILVSGNWTVFENDEMNTAYVEGGGYEITDNDSWKEFVAAYNNGAVTDDTPVTINGDITIDSTDDLPTSSISLNNISYDSFTITVGSDSYDLMLTNAFQPIFTDTDFENNVTYYFGVDSWNNFTSSFDNINKDNVYLKLKSSIDVPDDVEQITEFSGHFDGNSDDCTITMPDCNINDFKPLFAEGLTTVENVQYSCNNITIDDVDGLNELSNNVSDWDDICVNYAIDLTKGDICPESSWTPIDDSDASFGISYLTDNENPHFIVFTTSCAADDMSSSPVYLKKGDSDIDAEHWRYSELIIDDDDCIKALLDNSNLTTATLKLTLGYDVDLETLVNDGVSLPLSYSGEFYQNNHTITLPPLTVSSTDVPKLFDDSYTGTPVEYTSGGLLITDATDLETFANNQEDWLTICKDITIGKEGETTDIELTDFIPTISKEFSITNNTGTFTVGSSSSRLDIADYMPVFENSAVDADIVDSYYLEISSPKGFEVLTNNSFDSSDDISLDSSNSPFDLTSIALGQNTTNSVTVYDAVTFYVPDSWSGDLFSKNGEGEITSYFAPSCYLVDELYQGTLFDSSKRPVDDYGNPLVTDKDFTDRVQNDAGHGTESSPYLIFTYGMLEKLVEIVNDEDEDEDYTSGMYVKLMSDINAQGNERLTDLYGNPSNSTPTVQFTNFKGHFDGNYHSIGGLTCPLFANLNSATIENLGIVDCKMAGNALAASATQSTVTMSYVSGVSLGLISQTNNTVTNCYAYNISTKATTPYNITAETTPDASGTHNILVGNCYTLYSISGGDYIKTDCTLFIPESNAFYTYNSSISYELENYISSFKWDNDFDWIESPFKSNVALLHNVIYSSFWNKNENSSSFGGYGDNTTLGHLYSWYIVDKENFTLPSYHHFRVKNIYYSRKTGAYDGLNTIYLPFAWDPSNDLYDKDGEKIEGAEVYLLADKLDGTEDNYNFNDDLENYYDYSQANSLLFFQPNSSDFAKISNALPTVLKIPSGKSGWYIKRTELANYGIYIADNKTETINGESVTYPNLYDRYWSDGNTATEYNHGRSFMDIDRLDNNYSGRAFHLGTFTELAAGTFGEGTYGSDYSCYKLNSTGTGFALVKADKSSVQPFRTFFAINDGGAHANAVATPSGAKALRFGIVDIADGNNSGATEIDGVPTEGIHLMTTDESKVYSLDGRYVGQYGNKKLAPGMYIMNGKKFVVK